MLDFYKIVAYNDNYKYVEYIFSHTKTTQKEVQTHERQAKQGCSAVLVVAEIERKAVCRV